MKDRFEYIIFISLGFLFKILGLKLSRKASYLIALLFYYLIPIRKKTTIENLTIAFPEFSKKKIEEIAFGSYRSFAITIVEILYMPNLTKVQAEKFISSDNNDIVLERFKENRGVILISAHFGNWEAMAISIGLQLNIPLGAVVKSQRNQLVSEWLNNLRSKWGNKIIPLGISIRKVYQTIKENNIVAMVSDQRGPADGIRVNLFGKKASVYAGTAALALKSKCPVFFCVAVRQKDYTYKTHFYEVSFDNLPENEDEKIIEISQRHTDLLEQQVRAHPEQWLWMHKRWKY